MKNEMKHFMILGFGMLLGFGISITANAASVTALSETGTVTSETLNVRSGPAKDEAAIGKLYQGDTVTITGETANGWYQIDYFSEEGYVSGNYVELGTGNANNEASGDSTSGGGGTQESLEDYEQYVPGDSQVDLFEQYKLIVIVAVMVIVVILIIITLHGIRKLDDDDDDDDDDYDNDYEDEEEYEDDEDADEYAQMPVRKRKKSSGIETDRRSQRHQETPNKKSRSGENANPRRTKKASNTTGKNTRNVENTVRKRNAAEEASAHRRVREEEVPHRRIPEEEPVRRRTGDAAARQVSSVRRTEQTPARKRVPTDTTELDIENFRVNVNPSFFEEEERSRKQINEPSIKQEPKESQEDLSEAMAKLEALQKEIEKIKKNTQGE